MQCQRKGCNVEIKEGEGHYTVGSHVRVCSEKCATTLWKNYQKVLEEQMPLQFEGYWR